MKSNLIFSLFLFVVVALSKPLLPSNANAWGDRITDAVNAIDALKPEVEALQANIDRLHIRPSYCIPPDEPNKRPHRTRIDDLQRELERLQGIERSERRKIGTAINDHHFRGREDRALPRIQAVMLALGRADRALREKLQALRSAPQHDCSPDLPPEDDGEETTTGQDPQPVRPPFTKPAPDLGEMPEVPDVPSGPVCEEDKEAMIDEAFRREHQANRAAQYAQNYVVDIAYEIAAYGGEPRPDSLEQLYRQWQRISNERRDRAAAIRQARIALQALRTKPCNDRTGGGTGSTGGITTGGGTSGGSGTTGGSGTSGGHSAGSGGYSAANCPQCDPIRKQITSAEAQKAQAEKDKADATKAHQDKLAEKRALEARIRQMERGLSGEQGVGAESTDPATGIRTTSYDNGRGQVEIKRFDSNGNQIGQTEYRRRPSTADRRQELEDAEAQMRRIDEALNQLNHAVYYAGNRIERAEERLKALRKQLAECLKKCKTAVVTPPRANCVGGTCGSAQIRFRDPEPMDDDIEIELEDARSTSGTNAFGAQEVEHIGRDGHYDPIDNVGEVVVPPTRPQVTTPQQPPRTPVETEPEVEITTPQPPVEPVEQTPPPVQPLQVSTSGSINFNHKVGVPPQGSPCPTPAGTVSVNSNNGNPLEIVSTSVIGSIQPKLTLSKAGNTLTAVFNCSSPENGTFTGQVSITVRDTVTGQTKTVSVSASGTVTGG